MKLCCQEVLVPGESYRERFEKLRDMGFTATEIFGGALWKQFDELECASQSADMPIVAMWGGYKGCLIAQDPLERASATSDLKKLLAMGHALGGTHVIYVPRAGIPNLPHHKPWSGAKLEEDRWMIESLREIVDEHKEDSSCILLEPRNRYEQRYLLTISEAADLIHQIQRPRVKIVADLFHMNIEERDPLASLADNIDKVAHIHISDSGRLEPGAGIYDFAKLGCLLAELEYPGACSVECGITGEAHETLRRTAQFLNSTLLNSTR
jgi:sugar phosphate isomerase/epimerase